MFDVANWVACLNGENGPGGTPSHEALSVSPQRALEISSVAGLPPWTETISAHLDWLQNPSNVMRGADLHPKDHSIQLFTDASNEGWGAHLDQSFTKGLWSDWEKRLHINVLELKAVSLALRSFKDQCQNQTVLVATDNSTVVAYINKQGGTHSAEMCALLWKTMTWCHHYHITLKARHIPGCLNVMADLLSRLGRSLRANLCKRSVVRHGKKATHKCSRAEGSFSGPLKVQGPVSKPNSVGCYRQLNSSSLHKQIRRNPLGGDVRSPVEDQDLMLSSCYHYQITLKARHIPGCLNVMADLLSR